MSYESPRASLAASLFLRWRRMRGASKITSSEQYFDLAYKDKDREKDKHKDRDRETDKKEDRNKEKGETGPAVILSYHKGFGRI